jgi:hypothetical protein
MMVVYLLVVGLLVFTAARVASAARSWGVAVVPATATTLGAAVYVACLVPGFLGVLRTATAYGLFSLLCLGLIGLAHRLSRAAPGRDEAGSRTQAPLTCAGWAILAAGLLAGLPLLVYFRLQFLPYLLQPGAPLPWDTVSYHLPAFIEFWQNGSLWAMAGPYQSYSFAFELIGNFLSHPFAAHWGLVLANTLALLFLIAAVAVLVRTLTRYLPLVDPVSWVPGAVLAVGLVTAVDPGSLTYFGKNDVFTTACLVAALGFVLELATPGPRGTDRQTGLAALAAAAAGLALGAKPSALAFIPMFTGAVWVSLAVDGATAPWARWRAIRSAAMVLVLAVALGGFWLVRNLLVLGRLSALDWAWGRSLLANLGNPPLYEVKRGSVLFVTGALALMPALYLAFRARKDRQAWRALLLLAVFHVTACVAFAVTPHALFHHDPNSSRWELRLGLPMFASAAVVFALTATELGSRCSRWPKRYRTTLVASLLLAGAIALPQRWRAAPEGLPGYDSIRGLPPSGVYRFVQAQASPLRIYAAGLRPYGLYGRAWANTLFYDLHSTALDPPESGQVRIAAVVCRFHPDLIAVSIDPHEYSGAATKPAVVDWLAGQPGLFEEVFSDDTASVFRVRSGAEERLRALVPAGYRLEMGG